MTKPMTGKVALITGGATGIGAAVAWRFAAAGAKVAVVGRRLEPLEALAREVGGLAIQGDVGDFEACQSAVQRTIEAYGQLDTLIANAGIEHFGSATEITLEQWRDVQRINVDGVLFASRAALPHLCGRNGSIVIVASVASLAGAPKYVGYLTSKAALLGLMRSLAFDFGPEQVRVNAICPGWVRTEMTERALQYVADRKGISLKEMLHRVTMRYPLRRMAEPDEIAASIQYLASSDASFVTGSVLVADGGGSIVDVGTLEFME
jgi:meso-butanediol dehydrogenase/(S,S)-butanediol dehydrogenase/diacetyl reductase